MNEKIFSHFIAEKNKFAKENSATTFLTQIFFRVHIISDNLSRNSHKHKVIWEVVKFNSEAIK